MAQFWKTGLCCRIGRAGFAWACLLVGTLLLNACTCQGEIVGGEPATGGATNSATVRRLSQHELGNTLEALVGVLPQALEQLPPDGLTFTFDRVVNGQTLSAAHLDGYSAIAAEVTNTLLSNSRLDDIASECADNILPPAIEDRMVKVNGSSLSIGPEFAVGPADNPLHGHTLYAASPSAAYTHQFDSVGRYDVSFSLVSNSAVSLEVLLDGMSINSVSGLNGTQTVTTSLEISEARGYVLQFDLRSNDDNLEVTFVSVVVEGPRDPGTGLFDSERQACVDALVGTFAAKAYRRPLSSAQRDELMNLYAKVKQDANYMTAVRSVLEAILSSPYFLYLVELGNSGDPLDSWEVAARLSYSICELPPDPQLRDAAANDELRSIDAVTGHARRLFEQPCAQRTLLRFFENWLWLNQLPSLNKSPDVFPEYTTSVRDGMQSEAQRYLTEMVWNENATLKTLLTASYSWPDPRSAFLYRFQDVTQQEKTELPEGRIGILTLPAVLAVTSPFESTSPVKRGVFVLDQLLCSRPPPPPPGIDITPPLPDQSATTRERWAQHSASEACFGCHSLIDPVGFAFEEFDGIGRHRTEENGQPIDASGGIPTLGIDDGSLVGAKPVIEALADSPVLTACFARHWFRFSLGRMETDSDVAALASLADAFEAESLVEAFISIVAMDVFTHRARE